MKRTGLALLVVLGILGVLSILTVAFVTLSRLERRASQQRIHATRALLLARSGIEDALARLSAGQDPSRTDTRYCGEDFDANGVMNAGLETAEQRYNPSALDTDACPLDQALRPSFFVHDRTGAGALPALLPLEEHWRGYSGRLSGNDPSDGSRYALKISSGGFHLNGGKPGASSALGYNAVLRRILGTLCEAIDRDGGAAADGSPVAEVDGFSLVDRRPSTGWESWTQVRDLALGGSRTKLAALQPYLALHAWVDRKVIAPNATAGMSDKDYRSWGEVKLDRAISVSGRAPDFERILGDIVGRAPVDLAWARIRKPALIALLAGLKGLVLDESTATPIASGDRIGTLRAVEIRLDWSLPTDDCRSLAGQILASTSDLATWDHWNAFCDSTRYPQTEAESQPALNAAQTAQDAAQTALDEAQAALDAAESAYQSNRSSENRRTLRDAEDAYDAVAYAFSLAQAALRQELALADGRMLPLRSLLKANFNPNSDLNKFNPNASLWRPVDKSDLLVYSTEFNLLPSAGAQELESTANVVGSDGRLLASRTLKATLSPPSLVRLSTQKEFVCEELGALGMPGDEQGARLPGGSGTPFLSRNRGLGKTWGHALSQPGLDDKGVSLQTYPEPCAAELAGGGLSIHPADYDGSVQLATVETREDEFYLVDQHPPLPPVRDMKLLARYTAGLDLDVADAYPAEPDGRRNWPDLQQVTYNGASPPALNELGNGLLHASRPNTLYPDGCYCERDRAPAYLDKGNADGFHGVVSFWIKSNHLPPSTNTYRGHPFLKWTNFSAGIPLGNSPDQFFFLGDAADPDSGVGLYCQFEVGHHDSDISKEHCFRPARVLAPHAWHLVTMFWDFRSPNQHDTGELLMDAGLTSEDIAAEDVYRSSGGNDPSAAIDITVNDLYGPHRLGLGRGRPAAEGSMTFRSGSGADATIDELALYDFGGASLRATPAPPASVNSPGVLAANRFKEGRYYRESSYAGLLAIPGTHTAAEYFSAPIRLEGASRIKAIAWTQVVPRGLKAPLPPLGQAGIDGDQGLDGTILLELADVAGTAYAKDASGSIIDTAFRNPSGTPVERSVSGPFRLHAVFLPNLADMGNTPILDPLALDDVTVIYEPLEGRRILSWVSP